MFRALYALGRNRNTEASRPSRVRLRQCPPASLDGHFHLASLSGVEVASYRALVCIPWFAGNAVKFYRLLRLFLNLASL